MPVTYAAPMDALCDALTVSGAKLSAMLRQVRDPALPAIGTWSVGETAHHVSGSGDFFLAAARGEAELHRLEDVDAGNARSLAEDAERDPLVLADRFDRGEEALVEYARQLKGDPVVSPFAGVEVPFSTVLGIELGEVLVHGFDIARAARLPWSIDPGHAVLTHEAYLPLLPYVLDQERAAGVLLAIDMRVRGMRRVVIQVEGGTLVVEEPRGGPVDCHLSVDPVTYLLLVFNRISPWKAILRGQLIPWGRRPWRATELGSLLRT